MKKMKIMTIIGTRPEIIRLSSTIKALDKYFNHILVHTGQNWDYELNEIFFEEFQLPSPDVYLDSVGEDLGETLGNIIAKSYKILKKENPDALLILGDTNSALSSMSAKRLKIPVFHMEAGNRCFDENLPEEINRRIVDHISDVNLAYTEHARRYLISEGIAKERIYVTGSPMKEVIMDNFDKISNSKILDTLGLEEGEYFIVSAHREDSMDKAENLIEIVNSINFIAEIYSKPIIYSVHPRSKKRIENLGLRFNDLVRPMAPFGFFDYNNLQLNSKCVISDSGTVPEEANILNFPAVCIRNSTERPESFDKGTVILTGIKKDIVLQSIDLAINMWKDGRRALPVVDYQDVNVSDKVVKLIQSYTHIVNQLVWRKFL